MLLRVEDPGLEKIKKVSKPSGTGCSIIRRSKIP
jgi:hypothetical protein